MFILWFYLIHYELYAKLKYHRVGKSYGAYVPRFRRLIVPEGELKRGGSLFSLKFDVNKPMFR